MLLAIGGGLVMASGVEAGGLLFVLSPLLMVLVVRFLLRGGWQDAGLRFNFKQSWGWYLLAVLLYPVLFLVNLAINVLLDFTTLTVPVVEVLPLLLAGFLVQLLPRMIFALSEEWGWRGYLEPRLARLGVPDFSRHLMVGILWGFWHFPLILATDYTTVSLFIFLPLFMLGIIFLAFIYGRMFKSSGTVWPAVIMHGMGNAVGFAIIEGNLVAFNNELWGSIVPGSIITTLIYAFIAIIIWRRPVNLAATAELAGAQ
ncbi:MAG: CPBP family intramembrane metalloprotease [Calditrichaeota bacterium]|nr:CPBP family intramembrane metalloprotease [Calditrichota bacterium]